MISYVYYIGQCFELRICLFYENNNLKIALLVCFLLLFFLLTSVMLKICTTLFPKCYPVNLQHSICKHVFSIRVENSVDPDQLASFWLRNKKTFFLLHIN